MDYTQARAYLTALQPGGMKMGLERMRRVLQLLGDPQRRLRVVHVAGTNGKGSTARMVQAILTAAGYRAGLYTSPSVTGLRDTITIDNVPISRADFAACVSAAAEQQPFMGDAGGLSEFECVTAAALLYFARQQTDIVVLECGMGGRDDATNVLDAPLAAVLTPIALDHAAWLGSTVEEIAANKCGIFRPHCAVVTSPAQNEDALGVILEHAAAAGLTVRIPNSAAAPIVHDELGTVAFCAGGETYTLPLTGTFQRDNALTALETIAVLREKGYTVDNTAIHAGLAAVAMPCRQEVFSREPLILLDGAHNPHGIAALADTLRRYLPDVPLTAVIGMLRDKDTAACAALLAPLCAHIVCCTPNNPRALGAETLAEQMTPFCTDVRVADSPEQALALARSLAGAQPLLVAGSFTVAAPLRQILADSAAFGKENGFLTAKFS